MALDQELLFFNQIKGELLTHNKGQFALIKATMLVGTFTTWEEAFIAGTKQFGNVPFLIKQVQEQDETAQAPALVVGAICAHV